MRKLIVCNIISLDGYYEGPGKNIMSLPFDEGFDEYCAERLRAADTLLLGHTTYEQFKDYWPSVVDNPEARPIEREISRMNNAIEKIVISDTLTVEDTKPWNNNTEIINVANAKKEITKIKNRQGKDILVFGSHVMWNELLINGLIDELHFMIGPALLGNGTPVFEKNSPVALQLLDSQTLKNSQLVLSRYAVRQ